MLYKWLKRTIVLLYIPSTFQSSCTIVTHLPIPLRAHQLGYGKDPHIIYLFGGLTTRDKTTDNIYKWNVTKPMTFIKLSVTTPTTRFISFSNNAVSLNDKVYFVGTDDGKWTSGNVYIFDTITEMWIDNTNVHKPPHPAIFGCLTANTTHLFFIGGMSGSTTFLDRLQMYDINNNQWFDEQIDIAPIKDNGWTDGYCQFVNEYLYVFGGEVAVSYNHINHIFKWNPNEKWTNIGYLPYSQSSGIAVHNDHIIYIIGGRIADYTVISNIYEFDTNIDDITNVYNMAQSLAYFPSGILNNKLYVFGGWDSDPALDPIDDVQICDIIEISRSTASPSIQPTTFNPITSAPTANNLITLDPTTALSTIYATNNHEPKSTENTTAITVENTITTPQNDYNATASELHLFESESTLRTASNTLKTTETLKEKGDGEMYDGVSVLVTVVFVMVIIVVVLLIVFIVICIYNYRTRDKKYGNKSVKKANPVSVERVKSASVEYNVKNDEISRVDIGGGLMDQKGSNMGQNVTIGAMKEDKIVLGIVVTKNGNVIENAEGMSAVYIGNDKEHDDNAVSVERVQSARKEDRDIEGGLTVEGGGDEKIPHSKCIQCGAETKQNVEGVFVCLLCKSFENEKETNGGTNMYDV